MNNKPGPFLGALAVAFAGLFLGVYADIVSERGNGVLIFIAFICVGLGIIALTWGEKS